MNPHHEISKKRDDVGNLEAKKTTTAGVLAERESAFAAATANLANSQTPATRKAYVEARDERDFARVAAEAAASEFERAKSELDAMDLKLAQDEFAAAAAAISQEAFLRSVQPEIDELLELHRLQDGVAKRILEKKAAHEKRFEHARKLAQRAGIHPPAHANADLNAIRETVIRRRRTEVSAIVGAPDVREWLSPNAQIHGPAMAYGAA